MVQTGAAYYPPTLIDPSAVGRGLQVMEPLPPAEATDMLSSLPAHLLDEILDLRDAVRTSVLSCAWRRRWESLPGLALCFPKGTRPSVIGRVLLRYNERTQHLQLGEHSSLVPWISGFDPPPAGVFAWHVLELKEQGVSEDDVMTVADMESRMQKKAYKELKEITHSGGKKPPPNPYPSAIKEIQAEEKKYVMDRLFNPKVIEIANKMKEERGVKLLKDRAASGRW